ncbi:MAG: 30S ribosomal protein S8 [Candidatus Dojkabacteria bacterium]|nr:30S ribosomal protein S8 [Candidatus Dojkabacteria bacterium]
MDLVSDALTRIRNAVKVQKKTVDVKKNKMVVAIVDAMKREGFVADYAVGDRDVEITLTYDRSGPVLSELIRVSKPGQRMYVNSGEMKPVLRGRGIGIVSTSQGVMTFDEAKKKKIGGEYICKIW